MDSLADLVGFVLWLRTPQDPALQRQQCEPFDIQTASKEKIRELAAVYWDHAHGED